MADAVAVACEASPPDEVVEIPSTQPEPAGVADAESGQPLDVGDAKQPEPAARGEAELAKVEQKKEVTCRRCQLPVQKAEAICTPKFREDLRWTCKACHAVKSQLARNGIELQSCLTEDDVVAFYQDARNERKNSVDQRLSYSQARGVLKKSMIESSSRVDRQGEHGEFQPLSYWELRGYNTAKIEELAEQRDHPILGPTYRVDITSFSTEFITKVTEERLLRMEADARQRQARLPAAGAAAAAAPAPSLELDLPMAVEVPETGKKRKNPEEKKAAQEQAKLERQEQKKRMKLESSAVAAAGKLLPQLQKCTLRLDQALAKAEGLSVRMPSGDEESIAKAKEALAKASANASKMLQGAGKGQSLGDMPAEVLLVEKELHRVVKDGNAAIRQVQAFLRAQKENAQPKIAARAKGDKK